MYQKKFFILRRQILLAKPTESTNSRIVIAPDNGTCFSQRLLSSEYVTLDPKNFTKAKIRGKKIVCKSKKVQNIFLAEEE